PHALVKQAKEAYDANKLEDAESLAIRARAADSKKTSWSLFEDTPNSMLNKIAKAKAKHDREESTKVLADARKSLEGGDLENAKKLAYQAQKLHGDYAWWEMGDRPSRLMAEIETAEHKRGGPQPSQGSTDIAHQPPAAGPGARLDGPGSPGIQRVSD